MNSTEIIRAIQQAVNEQAGREWARARSVKPVKLFDEIIRIDEGTTQGHIGIRAAKKELWLTLAGSDGTEPGNPDWIGKKGNFNAGCMNPFASRVPLTKKIKTKARVHKGNLYAWKEIKAKVFRVIKKYPWWSVYVSGQSKGGSIAEIGGENVGFRFPDNPTRVISISGNCTGNKYFMYALYQHTQEFVKIWAEKDPVPMVPWWFEQPYDTKILERRDITALWKKLLWALLPFDHNSHYPDLVLKLAKQQLTK